MRPAPVPAGSALSQKSFVPCSREQINAFAHSIQADLICAAVHVFAQISFPFSENSPFFSSIPFFNATSSAIPCSAAYFRTSSVIFIELSKLKLCYYQQSNWELKKAGTGLRRYKIDYGIFNNSSLVQASWRWLVSARIFLTVSGRIGLPPFSHSRRM